MIKFEDLDLADRYTLLNTLPKSWRHAVEIGVWEGWFTQHIIMRTLMIVVAIDPWSSDFGGCEYIDSNKLDEHSGDGWASQETRYFATMKNLEAFVERGKCSIKELNLHDPRMEVGFYKIWRTYSYKACEYIDNNEWDFVYIDGDHGYEAVKRDIIDWWPKLQNGRILAGHDYHSSQPGVIQAVNEFVKESGRELRLTGVNEALGDSGVPSWVIIK